MLESLHLPEEAGVEAGDVEHRLPGHAGQDLQGEVGHGELPEVPVVDDVGGDQVVSVGVAAGAEILAEVVTPAVRPGVALLHPHPTPGTHPPLQPITGQYSGHVSSL